MHRIQKIAYILTDRKYVEDIAQQSEDQDWFDFIIIGAGVSGLQAAEILIKEGKRVLVIEASKYLGGRIKTERIKEIAQTTSASYEWVNKNPVVQQCGIEHGATWISTEHKYTLRWIKQLRLNMYYQYTDGVYIYGENEGNFKKVDSMHQFYSRHRVKIAGLVKIVQSIAQNIKRLEQAIYTNPSNQYYRQQYKKYLSLYDNVNVKSFMQRYIKDKNLLRLILHEIEAQECVSCTKESMLQVILSDSAFANLKVYIGMEDQHPDQIKLRQGTEGLIKGMVKKIQEEYQKAEIGKGIKNNSKEQTKIENLAWLHQQQPVLEIKNQVEKPYAEIVTTKRNYKCFKVIFSAPLAVSHAIKITNISESKKIVFENQEYGQVMKVFLVFRQAFWRTKFSGNGYFSQQFPFTQVMQMSPPNLSCGILAFFFCADKVHQWEERFEMNKQEEKLEKKKQYLLKIIADMFLEGNRNHSYLSDVLIAQRSFYMNQFVRACYQSVTKPGAYYTIQNLNKDVGNLLNRDENNIIFIGSQLSRKFSTYVEGGIRCAREKIYGFLGKEDPWEIQFRKFE